MPSPAALARLLAPLPATPLPKPYAAAPWHTYAPPAWYGQALSWARCRLARATPARRPFWHGVVAWYALQCASYSTGAACNALDRLARWHAARATYRPDHAAKGLPCYAGHNRD